MTTSRRFEDQLFEYYNSLQQYFRGQPIILGGVSGPSGGVGGPPGGFIGYLPQTRVAYDESELASSGIPISGRSLLDNLNHIRWSISQISASGGATVLDDLTDVNTSGKSDGEVLTWDNDTTTWVASGISQTAPSGPVVINNQFIFTIDNLINGEVVGTLPLRLYAHDITGYITEIACALNTVPVSSGVRIDILKNGTSILGSPNYIEIPVGSGFADSANITTSGFIKNDYFQIEVVQEDSDASDLSVHVRYYWET